MCPQTLLSQEREIDEPSTDGSWLKISPRVCSLHRKSTVLMHRSIHGHNQWDMSCRRASVMSLGDGSASLQRKRTEVGNFTVPHKFYKHGMWLYSGPDLKAYIEVWQGCIAEALCQLGAAFGSPRRSQSSAANVQTAKGSRGSASCQASDASGCSASSTIPMPEPARCRADTCRTATANADSGYP